MKFRAEDEKAGLGRGVVEGYETAFDRFYTHPMQW